MPSKTKTALATLFILGPISVVVLAGPNNRIDDRGSVRAVSVAMSTECVSSLRRLLNTGINPDREVFGTAVCRRRGCVQGLLLSAQWL